MVLRSSVILFIVLLISIWVVPQEAAAYVHIEYSEPGQEVELEEDPGDIRVKFTQDIDPKLSKMTLRDDEGNVIDTEQWSYDNLWLILDTPPLDDGVYEVQWEALSLDSTVSEGSFRFSIGEELPPSSSLDDVSMDEMLAYGQAELTVHDHWKTVLRAMELLLFMIIGGWTFFHGWLWTKTGDTFIQSKKTNPFGRKLFKRQTAPPPVDAHTIQHQRLKGERQLYVVSVLILLFTGFSHLLLRASELTGASMTEGVFWQTAGQLLASQPLIMISWGQVLVIILLYLLTYGEVPRWRLKSILVFIGFLTFPWTGHALHADMILSHSFHMFAIVIWFSGLIGFLIYTFLVREETDGYLYLHERFKVYLNLTLLSLLVVLITGSVLAAVYLESWEALTGSTYGQTLMWKIGIFSILVLFLLLQRFVWLRRSAEGIAKWQRADDHSFQQSVQPHLKKMVNGFRLQCGLIVILFMVTAFLSTYPVISVNHDHSHGDDIAVELISSHEQAGEIDIKANVWGSQWFEQRERIEDLNVTFEAWEQPYEDILLQVEEFCAVNDIPFDYWKNRLVEQGFIMAAEGKQEGEQPYYAGQIDLSPGLWNVRVTVKDTDRLIYVAEDFLLQVY